MNLVALHLDVITLLRLAEVSKFLYCIARNDNAWYRHKHRVLTEFPSLKPVFSETFVKRKRRRQEIWQVFAKCLLFFRTAEPFTTVVDLMNPKVALGILKVAWPDCSGFYMRNNGGYKVYYNEGKCSCFVGNNGKCFCRDFVLELGYYKRFILSQ